MGNADDADILTANNRRLEKELNAAKTALLDKFAAAALAGLCAATPGLSAVSLAEKSYKIADAMAAEKRSRAGLPLIV